MIIDAHCHAGTGSGLTGPWDTVGELPTFLRRSAAAGIGRTIVYPVFTDDYAAANRRLAAIVREHPGRLWSFLAVHGQKDRRRMLALVAEGVRLGHRGIKVHTADGRISREVCDAARRFRLPIVYDVMGRPAPMDLIAQEYPDVDFILPHLGSFSDDYRAHLQVIDLIARRPNLYADTSGVRRFDYLVDAVRRAGPSKIIFGSDGPWLHPALELRKVRLLGLPPADAALILGGNILRLLRRARHGEGQQPRSNASTKSL